MIRAIILFLIGGLVGAFINWAIFAWAFFSNRTVSPWTKPSPDESPRTVLDRIPIIGWLGRRRDSGVHGNGFWIRPMLIEIVFALGLPCYYFWHAAGGLTDGVAPTADQTMVWFAAHGILLALMCIATFIDFDEKMIPDEITIPGTLIALCFAAWAPSFRLPQLVPNMAGKVPTIVPVDFYSPEKIGAFHHTYLGLGIALLVFFVWIFALWPKLPVWHAGLAKTCRFIWAHAMRPKRKTDCPIRTTPRAPFSLTVLLLFLLPIGLIAITLCWKFLPAVHWDSLYGALIGLAFAGGLIWSIRIVGTLAMQQEAMGFGDVTLMAMFGAFLGWQASLLAFVIAPFAALFVVAGQFLFRRERVIAFGPYLCAGATVLLFFWAPIWQHASKGVFAIGPLLVVVLIGGVILMGVMLFAIQWFKGLFGEEVSSHESVH